MKHKDGKLNPHSDKGPRIVPLTLVVLVLCGFSFYLGGLFGSERNRVEANEVKKAVSAPKEAVVAPLQIKSTTFPECSSDYQDYTPCTDPRVLIYSCDSSDYLGYAIDLYSIKCPYT